MSSSSFYEPDPYMWLECLEDPKVVKWAYERDRKAREALKSASEGLYPKIKKYYSIPMVIAVEVTRKGVFTLARALDEVVTI